MYRYERLDVQCLDTVRKYHQDIPRFLLNRPRHFLDHCLRRMPPCVSAIGSNLITDNGSGVFTVCSADSDKVYTVNVTTPHCSCFDWQEHNLPCKHMLAVFNACPSWGWDSLPAAYRNIPHFRLDPEVSDSVPVSSSPDMSTHNVPVDDEPDMSTHSVPVDDEPDLSTHNVPVDDEPDLSTHSVPVDDEPDMSTHSVPVDDEPDMSTHSVLFDSEYASNAAVSESTLKLQSRVRQLTQIISSYTYSITDDSLLSETVDIVNNIVGKFKAVLPRQFRSRVNSRRRFAKATTQAACLRRRLHMIRAKRALRRRRRHHKRLQGMPHYMLIMCTVHQLDLK